MPLDSEVEFTPPQASTDSFFGSQRVILGDALNVMRGMQANCIDIIVTSPPYNIGIGYNSYADSLPRDSYLAWLRNVAVEIRRVMKPSGSFFLNIGSTNIDPWLPWDVAQAFRDLFVLQNHIVWVKSLSIGDDTVGHFKPISSRRFINQNNESIFHFTSTGHVEVDRLAVGVPFKDKTNIARWGHKMDRRCAGNVWFIPYKTVRSKAQKFDHPAGFPVELPERCIKLHGIQQEALVLDPFMGAGSTLVAAERLGLRGIGIEIDKTYLEAALVRLSENVDANRAACCV